MQCVTCSETGASSFCSPSQYDFMTCRTHTAFRGTGNTNIIILDEHRIIIRSSSPLRSIAPNTKGTGLDQNGFVWIALEAKTHAIIRSNKTLAKSHPCLWGTAKQGQKPKGITPKREEQTNQGEQTQPLGLSASQIPSAYAETHHV